MKNVLEHYDSKIYADSLRNFRINYVQEVK